jgi:hypothetical protein
VDGPFDEDISTFIRSDRRIIGSETFAATFDRQARKASKEVPARERRSGTPSVGTILAESAGKPNGVTLGVVRAHAGGYSVRHIAQCTGLPRLTVERLIRKSAASVTLD